MGVTQGKEKTEDAHLWLWGGTKREINSFLLHKLTAWSSESMCMRAFHVQHSAQLHEASMRSMEQFGYGQCQSNHRHIIPVGWELSLLGLPQLIFSVLTVILEKHFVQISSKKHKSTWGNQVCSMEGKFADKDTKITLASAAPLSIRVLPNPALNCTTAPTAGAAPCHNHNLFFQSSFFIFTSFSFPHNQDSAVQIARLPPGVFLGYSFSPSVRR